MFSRIACVVVCVFLTDHGAAGATVAPATLIPSDTGVPPTMVSDSGAPVPVTPIPPTTGAPPTIVSDSGAPVPVTPIPPTTGVPPTIVSDSGAPVPVTPIPPTTGVPPTIVSDSGAPPTIVSDSGAPVPVTPVPTTATPAPPTPPRVCTEDAACRVFGDGTATCTTSRHCACGTHSGELCEIAVTSPAPTGVHMSVGIALQVPCNRAGSQALLDTLRAEASARGAQDVSAGASCGTLSVALSGVVPDATTAATADALVGALGAAAVVHSNITNVTHASQLDPFVQTAQTSGRNTTAVCTQEALNTMQTYDGRCLVISCNDGFVLHVETRDGKDYQTCARVSVHMPQPTSTPAPDAGDDDLSAGAIAGIVVGCVAAVAVLALVLVWYVGRAAGSKQQQDSHPTEPADA